MSVGRVDGRDPLQCMGEVLAESDPSEEGLGFAEPHPRFLQALKVVRADPRLSSAKPTPSSFSFARW